MLNYEHLKGIPFKHGSDDCLGLVRRFYKDNFGIEITNYARYDDWWLKGDNFYMELPPKEGFEFVHCHPSEYRIADMILMAIRSEVPNHAGILVENGQILHHFWARMSSVDLYKGIWRNTTVAVMRHKTLKDWKPEEATIDIKDLLPQPLKQKYGL